MIRTDREYQNALRDRASGLTALAQYRAAIEAEGLDPEIAERLMGPMLVTKAQTEREIQVYEEARNGKVDPSPWSDLGGFLIHQRIAKGMTQRELAERLGVDESVVSRDERNEYRGVTKERAEKIAHALSEELYVMTASEFRRLKSPHRPIFNIEVVPPKLAEVSVQDATLTDFDNTVTSFRASMAAITLEPVYSDVSGTASVLSAAWGVPTVLKAPIFANSPVAQGTKPATQTISLDDLFPSIVEQASAGAMMVNA